MLDHKNKYKDNGVINFYFSEEEKKLQQQQGQWRPPKIILWNIFFCLFFVVRLRKRVRHLWLRHSDELWASINQWCLLSVPANPPYWTCLSLHYLFDNFAPLLCWVIYFFLLLYDALNRNLHPLIIEPIDQSPC